MIDSLTSLKALKKHKFNHILLYKGCAVKSLTQRKF